MRVTVRSADGILLRGVHHPAVGPARGVLLLGHAMMVDSRSLDRPPGSGFASHLASRGFETYRFDLRGHGESLPTTAEGCEWSYDTIVFEDLPAWIGHVGDLHPELPMAVLGHSLTGHTGLARLGLGPRLPVSAFVALATNIWARPFEPSRWKWVGKRILLEFWLLVARWFGYFPGQRLGVGPADVSVGMIAQCVRWARKGGFLSLDDTDFVQGMARIDIPVLSIACQEDRYLAPRVEVDRLMDRLLSAPVERWVVPGTHMGVVCDPSSRAVWDRVADWLDQTLPPVGDHEEQTMERPGSLLSETVGSP